MATIQHPQLDQVPLTLVLHALADSTRLQLVRNIASTGGGACSTLCDQTQPSRMSYHMRILREAGLVRIEPKGQQRIATLRRDEVEQRFPGLLDLVLDAREPL